MADSDSRPEGGTEAEIAFQIVAKPYVFGAAAFGAALLMAALAWIARRDADPIAIPLAAAVPALLLAWHGFASLWLLSRSPRFRIDSDGVEMTSGRWKTRTFLPFERILGIDSRLIRSERIRRGAIVVATDRRRIRIPRWIDGDGREALDAILARTWRAQRLLHMPLRSDDLPIEEGKVPDAIRDALDVWKLRGPDAPVYLFRGPVRKAIRRRVPIFIASAVAAAIGTAGLILSREHRLLERLQFISFVVGALGLVGVVVLSLPLRLAVRPSWLLLSARGALRCAGSRRKELVWGDVETIGTRSFWQALADQNRIWGNTFKDEEVLPQLMMLRYFMISGREDERIIVFDMHDAPLPVIEALCRRFHEARAESTG